MLLQRIRVPSGFAYAALFLYFCRPTAWALMIGVAIALAGLGLRIWAAGHLEKFKGLSQSGPYRFTRNPLYLGSFLMGLGISLAGGVWWLALLFLLLFPALYLPVMRREELELHQAYGEGFQTYRRGVPLFLPWLLHQSASGERIRFRWSRVRANREYNAVLGLLILVIVLIIKMYWYQ